MSLENEPVPNGPNSAESVRSVFTNGEKPWAKNTAPDPITKKSKQNRYDFKAKGFFQTLCVFAFALLPLQGFPEPFELCYFDLSGKKDGEFLKKNLEEFSIENEDMTIHTHFQEERTTDIKAAFKEMVEKGENCKGLVISGYHTGGHFHKVGGETKEDKNKLDLSFIEELSCNPDYKRWFENVRQLWLFGSYTSTSNKTTGNKAATAVTDLTDSKENISSNLARLNLSFAHVMDEGTPLSSRYMRAFPNTNLYGWSGEAPTSEQVESQEEGGWKGTNPVFEHIKQIGRAIQAKENKDKGEDEGKTNPSKISVDRNIVIKGINTLFTGNYCDQWSNVTEDNRTEGAKKNDYGDVKKLGCELINAQKKMDQAKNRNKQEQAREELLTVLRKINAVEKDLEKLRNSLEETQDSQSKKIIKDKIKKIIGEKYGEDDTITVSHLLFNEIYSSYRTAEKYLHKSKDPFFKEAKETLHPGSPMIQALKDKTKSSTLSTVRKVDYIKFYQALHGDKDGFVSDSVQTLIDDELKCAYYGTEGGNCKKKEVTNSSLLGIGRGDHDKITDRHHYTLTAVVADQLKQYELLNEKQTETLANTLKNAPKEASSDLIQQVQKNLDSLQD